MQAKAWSETVTVILINPNSTVSMTEAMLAVARNTVPDMVIEGWTSHDGPPAIQGRADGEAAAAPLLALVDKAAALGTSGLIVGCFDDTALAEVRARVEFPVVGIGQIAYAICHLRGWRFSVVTTLPVSIPILEENIEAYGYAPLLGKVRASGLPVLDIEASPEASAERILAEAEAAVEEDDIDAVVLGCAGMVQVTALLRARLSCAVVDPVEAASGCLRWLIHQG